MSMPPPPSGDQPPFSQQPAAGGPAPYGSPQYGSPQYGSPPPGYAPYGGQGNMQPTGTSGMAIAGFVLSLVGLVPCFWFWFLQVPGVLGTIFSVLGLKATKNGAKKGRGLAIAGLVVGIIVILIALGITAYVYTSDNCVHEGMKFECVTT